MQLRIFYQPCESRFWLLVNFTADFYSLGSMGFDRGESQYLTAPPYVAGAGLMVLTAWVGDKYHIRGPLIIANCVITIIGLVVMAFPKGNAVRYFGVFLTVMGTSANIPTIMAYQANNIVGQWKRAMSSAIFVGMGGIGGIAGALVFRSQDAPQYRPGIIACLA
jgi:MFS family permease